MFCKNCGRKIDQNARSCPHCGEKQPAAIEAKFFDGVDEVFYASWTGAETPKKTTTYSPAPAFDNKKNEEESRIQSALETIQKDQRELKKEIRKQGRLLSFAIITACVSFILVLALGVLFFSKANTPSTDDGNDEQGLIVQENVDTESGGQATEEQILPIEKIQAGLTGTWSASENKDFYFFMQSEGSSESGESGEVIKLTYKNNESILEDQENIHQHYQKGKYFIQNNQVGSKELSVAIRIGNVEKTASIIAKRGDVFGLQIDEIEFRKEKVQYDPTALTGSWENEIQEIEFEETGLWNRFKQSNLLSEGQYEIIRADANEIIILLKNSKGKDFEILVYQKESKNLTDGESVYSKEDANDPKQETDDNNTMQSEG